MSSTQLDPQSFTEIDPSHLRDQARPSGAARLTAVNPWAWQDALGFAQGTLVEGGHRTLHVAGQCSIDADGTPLHADDMAAQVRTALDNVETVLAAAGMTLSDVVRYDVYTTDMSTTHRVLPPFAGATV